MYPSCIKVINFVMYQNLMKNQELGKIVLLSAALTAGCSPWRISVNYPYEDEPNYKNDCSNNLPPQIEINKKNKTISIYDPDNTLELFGWDLDQKVVYATDECRKTTLRKFGKQ